MTISRTNKCRCNSLWYSTRFYRASYSCLCHGMVRARLCLCVRVCVLRNQLKALGISRDHKPFIAVSATRRRSLNAGDCYRIRVERAGGSEHDPAK